MNNGHWDFPEQMGVGTGFVYCIFDRVLKRVYLGKKSYLATKQGRLVPSGWERYKGSSETMKAILANRPPSEFSFICIEQYRAKGALSYAETWSLCFLEAPTTKSVYNTRIEKVSWNVHENITDRHKARLKEIKDMLE